MWYIICIFLESVNYSKFPLRLEKLCLVLLGFVHLCESLFTFTFVFVGMYFCG